MKRIILSGAAAFVAFLACGAIGVGVSLLVPVEYVEGCERVTDYPHLPYVAIGFGLLGGLFAARFTARRLPRETSRPASS